VPGSTNFNELLPAEFARGVSKKPAPVEKQRFAKTLQGQPQSRPNPKKLLLKARGCESLQDAHSKNKNQYRADPCHVAIVEASTLVKWQIVLEVGCSAVSLPNARTAARGPEPVHTNRAAAGYCSKGILFYHFASVR
jgi:hypothetical protein